MDLIVLNQERAIEKLNQVTQQRQFASLFINKLCMFFVNLFLWCRFDFGLFFWIYFFFFGLFGFQLYPTLIITIGLKENGKMVLNNIVDGICDCLMRKEALSDDMLVLAWQYCKLCEKESKFLNILNTVINSSLSDGNICKTRDYLWIKEYLLNSSILLENYYNKTSEQVETVYDYIVKSINKQIDNHKLYIKEEIDKLETKINKSSLWKLSTQIENNDNVILRQDSLECNKPEYDLSDLVSIESEKIYDSSSYLTKLLINAKSLDASFQREMKAFQKCCCQRDEYIGAPVKLMPRCLIKSQTVEPFFFVFVLLIETPLITFFLMYAFALGLW